MGNVDANLKHLSAVLSEKRLLLQAIRDIGEQQIVALQTEDLPLLDSLLQQKQALMDRVEAADATIAERWQQVWEDLGYASWEELRSDALGQSILGLREEIRLLLVAMLEQDDQQRLLGQAILARYGRLLQELSAGVSALRTYAQSQPEGQVSSLFVNRKL